MATWRMEDDLLAPTEKLKIEYRGKNPFSAYQKIRGIITDTFQITSANYWERDFRWDISGDPRSFYVRIYARRPLDSRSHILAEFLLQGSQPKDPEKNGEVFIQIRGKLVTEYKLTTAIQNTSFYKSLLYLYERIFYWNIRRQYLQIGKNLLYEVHDKLRKSLGIE